VVKSLSKNILKKIDDNHKPAVRMAILQHMILTTVCTRYKGGLTTLCHPSCSVSWKLHLVVTRLGHTVAQLVEALHYKSEGRGFDSQWCQWNFSLT